MRKGTVIAADGDFATMLELLGVREHAGWRGAFSTKQFPGAIPNGTPIEKVKFEDGDVHPLGHRGKVLGSIQPLPGIPVYYFVEWDDMPKVAFGVIDWKLAAVKQ